ncbi:MAG: hypothetical protein Kow0059_15360 [Candidatus Sumerlaeia bacterium]
MRRLAGLLIAIAMTAILTGCVMTGGTDLSEVADSAGLKNVTTGDGTFENYTATGHWTAHEIGIGVGVPFIGKFMELYPAKSNEALLTEAAMKAKEDNANAMINVTPHEEWYSGFPLFFIGLYVDRAEGTGINVH